MKQTCENCKALKTDNSEKSLCGLGYNSENFIPLEECPKPMIYLDYIELVQEYSRNTYGKIERE